MNILLISTDIISNYRTDTFTVGGTSGTGVSSPPTICGTNTGEHSKLQWFEFFITNNVNIGDCATKNEF